MIRKSLFPFVFVFFLCFATFLAGWLTAVYIVPGGFKVKQNPQPKDRPRVLEETKDNPQTFLSERSSKAGQILPFLEEMTNNILLLFNPYEMDSALKEGTHLKNKTAYIRKSRKDIVLKNPPTSNRMKALKFPQNSSFPGPLDQKLFPEELAFKSQELPSPQTEQQIRYDKKNREQLAEIAKSQNIFKRDGKFSFLVNVFSEEEEALEYIQKMKRDYPLWSFLIKAESDHIRIYLGPISSRREALEFKESLPRLLPFSFDFLEEVSL